MAPIEKLVYKDYKDTEPKTKDVLSGLEKQISSPKNFLEKVSIDKLHKLFGYIYKQNNPELSKQYTDTIQQTSPYKDIINEIDNTTTKISEKQLQTIIKHHTNNIQDTVGVIQFYLMLQNQDLANTVRYIDGIIGPKTMKGINTYYNKKISNPVSLDQGEKKSDIAPDELTTHKEVIDQAERMIQNYRYHPEMCGGVVKNTLNKFGIPITSLYVPNMFDQLAQYSDIEKYDSRDKVPASAIQPGDIFVAGNPNSHHRSSYDNLGGKDHIGFLTGNMTDKQGPETIEALNTNMVGKYPLCYQIDPHTQTNRTIWILKPRYKERLNDIQAAQA